LANSAQGCFKAVLCTKSPNTVNAEGVGQFQPRVASTLGKHNHHHSSTLKEFIPHMPNAFSVCLISILLSQGCRKASNPGLELANAFGIIANAFGVKSN
jgi:hypothetical protein